MKQHYHQAKYEDDKLLRTCAKCGEDLLHESHIKEKQKKEKLENDLSQNLRWENEIFKLEGIFLLFINHLWGQK